MEFKLKKQIKNEQIKPLKYNEKIMPHTGIKLSPKALEEAIKIKKNNDLYTEKALRLYIEGKGCDGFYYGVVFDDIKTDDQIFEQAPGIVLVVDIETYFYVKESIIDWLETDQESGFLVVNPKHDRFRGKFYESPRFQKALRDYNNEDK